MKTIVNWLAAAVLALTPAYVAVNAGPSPDLFEEAGIAECWTDASGYCPAVRHELNDIPSNIQITPIVYGGSAWIPYARADWNTANSFTVRAMRSETTPRSNTFVKFYWKLTGS